MGKAPGKQPEQKRGMMDNQLKEKIIEIAGSKNVILNEQMAEHTSMKVGGPADIYCTPDSCDAFRELVKLLSKENEKFYVLGNASNVVIRDAGFRGVIIQLTKLDGISIEKNTIHAQAGALLKNIAAAALEVGLGGFEFASGIPGSLGGALAMNAGAYGGEMRMLKLEVNAFDTDGREYVFKNDDMDFGYRHSIFSEGGLFVSSAAITLEPGKKETIKARMDELNELRASKQPLEFPSCGSVFKRPEGTFTGKLIQEAGMAGARVGGASVSRKHCGFIINDRDALAADVLGLVKLIQRNVKENSGVELECEIKIL